MNFRYWLLLFVFVLVGCDMVEVPRDPQPVLVEEPTATTTELVAAVGLSQEFDPIELEEARNSLRTSGQTCPTNQWAMGAWLGGKMDGTLTNSKESGIVLSTVVARYHEPGTVYVVSLSEGINAPYNMRGGVFMFTAPTKGINAHFKPCIDVESAQHMVNDLVRKGHKQGETIHVEVRRSPAVAR